MNYNEIKQFTKFGSYQIDVDFIYFVKHIQKFIDDFGLILNPDFQRGHVWTEEQQIKYIEYVLSGGTSGKIIYLNKPDWMQFGRIPSSKYNDFVVVDGLQRITAMQRFFNNEIKVYNTYYKAFEGHVDLDCGFKININNLKSKKEVLIWYLEMNFGGTPHTESELKKVKDLIVNEN